MDFFGLPLFLLPLGFHVRACRVNLDVGFRSVCPIQPHRLLLISISKVSCFVRCHSSTLLMVSGPCILSIRLWQLFMKVWTFLVVFLVVLHVSDPYTSTALLLNWSEQSLNTSLDLLHELTKFSNLNVNFCETNAIWIGILKYRKRSIKTKQKLN